MVRAVREDPSFGERNSDAILVNAVLPGGDGLHRDVAPQHPRRICRDEQSDKDSSRRRDLGLRRAHLLLLLLRAVRSAYRHGEQPESKERQEDDPAHAADSPRCAADSPPSTFD